MCGCEAHRDSAAKCTCICPTHSVLRARQTRHATPPKSWPRKRFESIRNMILVPYAEGDDSMSIPDRLRTQDNNAEISWIFSRGNWVLAWGWSWFCWGLGIDVYTDTKEEVGVWLTLGPLTYGIFRERP